MRQQVAAVRDVALLRMVGELDLDAVAHRNVQHERFGALLPGPHGPLVGGEDVEGAPPVRRRGSRKGKARADAAEEWKDVSEGLTVDDAK